MPYKNKRDLYAAQKRYRQRKKEQTKHLTMLAYWAGFVDADGTIKIIKRRAGKKRIHCSYIPYLAVTNTNKKIILRLKKDWQCGTIWHKKPFKLQHKDAWAWYVSSKQCITILQQLLPYLRVKLDRAKLILEFYKRCEFRACGKNGTPENIVKLREEYRQKMLELNKRGK